MNLWRIMLCSSDIFDSVNLKPDNKMQLCMYCMNYTTYFTYYTDFIGIFLSFQSLILWFPCLCWSCGRERSQSHSDGNALFTSTLHLSFSDFKMLSLKARLYNRLAVCIDNWHIGWPCASCQMPVPARSFIDCNYY